jgi:exopolysaccharide biosynthesis protein
MSAMHGPLAAQASLSVRVNDHWIEWWRSDRAPAHWSRPDSTVMSAVHWRSTGAPIEWGDVELSGAGEAWRLKAIVVRLDPRRFRFRLATRLGERGSVPEWTVDSAPANATLAVNAGQFAGPAPWGWVVHNGAEVRTRGHGPLAVTVVFDSSGAVTFVEDSAAGALSPGGGIVEAFQSYPLLLTGDGQVPPAFHRSDPLLDLEHRDSRLGLGLDRGGHLILMLTRFNGLGGTLDRVPVGITVPEMAAIMGALGCRTAVALDGGISGQILLRTADTTAVWRGWRKVPLGLVATPRE